MVQTWCPDLSADPAVSFVGEAHNTFLTRALQVTNLSIGFLGDFANIDFDPYEFNVDFNFDGQLTPFQRPPRPTINDAEFQANIPAPVDPAPQFIANPLTFDPAPAFDVAPPTLTFGVKPATPNIVAPIAPPAPGELEMPLEPDYVLPPTPSFESLNLPTKPNIVIPEFEGEKPIFIEPPFNETWHFQPEPYTKVLLDKLVAAIDPMLQAKSALPEAIEEALFQRSRSRIEVETNRQIDQAITDFGNRGFTEPPGMLHDRALQLRQAGINAQAENAREVAIKQYEETLQNLRFAIVQGAALEGVFVQLHLEEQRMALQAATFLRESAVALLNARIAIINAKNQAYLTEAQVFETRIRAALANVELYRAEIEGELAKGQVNEQRVRLYEGLLRGIQVIADFYRTRVEAVKVRADADRNIVDRFKAEVDAFDSRWRAHTSELQAYTAGNEAQGKIADVYKTFVEANAKRVDAWQAQGNFNIEAERLRINQHGQQLAAWEGGIRRFGSIIDGERARLSAVGQKADALARMYTADAAVEQAASAASDRSFELGLQKARAEVDTQLNVATTALQQLLKMRDQIIAITEAKARVGTQLAASTMSAVNYSAGVSSSRGKSSSCSTNFSFVGEPADA